MRGVAYGPFFPDLQNRGLIKLRLMKRVEHQPETALKTILYATHNRGGRVAIKLLETWQAYSMLPVLCRYTPEIRKDR